MSIENKGTQNRQHFSVVVDKKIEKICSSKKKKKTSSDSLFDIDEDKHSYQNGLQSTE